MENTSCMIPYCITEFWPFFYKEPNKRQKRNLVSTDHDKYGFYMWLCESQVLSCETRKEIMYWTISFINYARLIDLSPMLLKLLFGKVRNNFVIWTSNFCFYFLLQLVPLKLHPIKLQRFHPCGFSDTIFSWHFGSCISVIVIKCCNGCRINSAACSQWSLHSNFRTICDHIPLGNRKTNKAKYFSVAQ